MPAISVTIDGKELATVALSDATLLSVHVNALRWNEELATVYMDGGDYTGQNASPYRIWIDELPLAPGQIVGISFVADAKTTAAGKTIAELFPDEPTSAQTDFTPTAVDLEEVSSRPILRDGYAFKLKTSEGTEHAGRTDPGEYGISLRATWASLHRPASVRFSVTSNHLDQLRTRSPAREHIKGELGIGQSLQFELGLASASD